MIDVTDGILKVDSNFSKFAAKMQAAARKYKWSTDFTPRPSPDYSRIPPKDSVICDLCGGSYSPDDMVLIELDETSYVWHGWCHSCRFGNEVCVNA